MRFHCLERKINVTGFRKKNRKVFGSFFSISKRCKHVKTRKTKTENRD